MQESSVYQHLLETTGKEHYELGLQQGTVLGARQTALESLFNVLEYKFDSNTVHLLRLKVENINDVHLLRQLHNAALRVEALESFIQILETSESKL